MNQLIIGSVGSGKTHLTKEMLSEKNENCILFSKFHDGAYDELLKAKASTHEVWKIEDINDVIMINFKTHNKPKFIYVSDKLYTFMSNADIEKVISGLIERYIYDKRFNESSWNIVFDCYDNIAHKNILGKYMSVVRTKNASITLIVTDNEIHILDDYLYLLENFMSIYAFNIKNREVAMRLSPLEHCLDNLDKNISRSQHLNMLMKLDRGEYLFYNLNKIRVKQVFKSSEL